MAKPGDNSDTNEIASSVLTGIVIPGTTLPTAVADTSGGVVDTPRAICLENCKQTWNVDWYNSEVAKFTAAYNTCQNNFTTCYACRQCESYTGMYRNICFYDCKQYCLREQSLCMSKISPSGGPLYTGDGLATGLSNIQTATKVKYDACVKGCPQ